MDRGFPAPCAGYAWMSLRMKRSEALQPLSRDHLNALIAAKKLREAEEAGEATRVLLDFWHGDGRHHFRVEEEVLLPQWALRAPVDRAAVGRMLDDHLDIRREALRAEAGEIALEELRELGQRLDDHVRFEERQLFPAIEQALDDEGLERLAAAVLSAEEEQEG